MSVKRSLPTQKNDKNQALSEPNLTLLTVQEQTNQTRSKRPRPPCSPRSDLRDFKEDINQILTTWKDEQQEYLIQVLSEQSKSISKLTSEITELKQQNLKIQKSNSEIEKAMAFMNQQYEELKKQIGILGNERKEYLHTISELEKKIIDVQQTSRSSSIEIRNVPATERETTSDLNQVISNLGNLIQTPINGVRDIYRIPGKTGTTKPIVVELTSVQEKEKFITAMKNYNKLKPQDDRLNTAQIGVQGKPQPVYVTELLPGSIKKLFHLAREFAKRNNYEFCLSVNGKVLLRQATGMKHIHVKSERFLFDLQHKQ